MAVAARCRLEAYPARLAAARKIAKAIGLLLQHGTLKDEGLVGIRVQDAPLEQS